MKYVSIILAAFILLAGFASAQFPTQNIDVPLDGYEETDVYHHDDLWNAYEVYVPRSHELEYSFQVEGNGSFRVRLVPEVGTEQILTIRENYFTEYSMNESTRSYSAIFPANHGFDDEFTILISSDVGDVIYTASISINEVDTPDYTIYYILLALGLFGIVGFSWVLVNRQEDEKKRIAQEARKSGRGKRRR